MDFNSLFDDLDYEELSKLERQFIALTPVDRETEPVLSDEDWREQLPPVTDLERVARWAEPLMKKYEDTSAAEWELSPLNWIRQVSSAHKRGKIGEELFVAWAESEGLDVMGRSHRGHDCMIHGLKIEVKTSLRWNNDRFVFFGLQPDFDYDAVALVAMEPDNVRLWIAPKAVVLRHARDQIRGAEAMGTKWLSFLAAKPPLWLAPWGGSLSSAFVTLTDLITRTTQQLDAHDSCDPPTYDAELLQLAAEIRWLWDTDSPEHPEPTPAQTTLHLIDTQQYEQLRSDPYVNN